MKEKNTYSLVDIMKFICAILIMISHILPDVNQSTFEFYFNEWTMRFCVPFFFIVTGFFLRNANDERINKYIKKIVFYYLISVILYLPFTIVGYRDAEHLLRDLFINGTHYHLWYFLALIFGVFVDKYFRKLNLKIQYVFIFILLTVCIFFNEYYKLFIDIIPNISYIHFLLSKIGTSRNGLFFALPLIALGRLSKQENYIEKKLAILIVLSFIECTFFRLYVENCWLEASLFNCAIAYYVFQICLKNKVNISMEKSLLLRKMSTIIYIIHPFIISIYIKTININSFILEIIVCFFACITISYGILNIIGTYKRNRRV